MERGNGRNETSGSGRGERQRGGRGWVWSRSQGGGCSKVQRTSQGGGGRRRAAGGLTCLLGRPAGLICPGPRGFWRHGTICFKTRTVQTKSTYWLPGYSFLCGGTGDRKGPCRKCDLASTDTDLKLQCLQFWAPLYLMRWLSRKGAGDKAVAGSVA